MSKGIEISNMEIVSKKLKGLRHEHNLSQSAVAGIIGVSRVVYNRYENNQREIPIEFLCVLADYYDVSMDYLVGREY